MSLITGRQSTLFQIIEFYLFFYLIEIKTYISLASFNLDFRAEPVNLPFDDWMGNGKCGKQTGIS